MSPYNPGYELSIYNSQGSHHRNSHPHLHPRPASTSDLLSLPLELHYIIIGHLDLESLLQLRRTSRLYYHVITPDLIRRLFVRNGLASLALTACCYECLSAPGLDRLVVDKNIGAFSWQSVCFRCWSSRITVDYHLNPWPVIQIANGDEGYICQFCNWPVVNNGRDDGVDRLHARCRARRRLVLFIWVVMAFLQFGIGVLCAVLAWTRYKHQPGVLIPSSVRLALLSAVCPNTLLILCIGRLWASDDICGGFYFPYWHQRRAQIYQAPLRRASLDHIANTSSCLLGSFYRCSKGDSRPSSEIRLWNFLDKPVSGVILAPSHYDHEYDSILIRLLASSVS